MQNYISPGDTITCDSLPYARNSGEGVQWGTQFGVCTTTGAISTAVECGVTGVFDLTALGGEAWTDGAAVYWDNANKRCTVTASTHLKIGHARGAKASAATTGRVRLTGAAA